MAEPYDQDRTALEHARTYYNLELVAVALAIVALVLALVGIVLAAVAL